jgi:phosphomannomutase
MNAAVVRRAAAALARYLGHGRVVVGYDARRNSDRFAQEAAAVLAGAGLEVLLLPSASPTPVLAFAVRSLSCAAGVMITASHNPAGDNGMKVYLGDGIQIVPPADAAIAAAMAEVRSVRNLPWAAPNLLPDLSQEYLAAVIARDDGPHDLRLAVTPLHGVGGDLLLRALERAGFPPPAVVTEQFAPDPDFPTAPFPNPELSQAVAPVLALGAAIDADAVIALDPDADRCAVGVAGRMLTGDELGALLGWWILHREGPRGVYANSIVSSRLLGRICAAAGSRHVETLTGFKWIARVPGLRYGYEEALGYCTQPGAVGDKDGISAAVLAARLLAQLTAEGRTALDLLDTLHHTHGLHATRQWTAPLRPGDALPDPDQLLGASWTDLGDTAATGLPATPGLVLTLPDDARVILRPSGTEPKLKVYFEVVQPDNDRNRAQLRLDELQAQITGWLQGPSSPA